MKLGKSYIDNVEISKLYIGNTLIYPVASATDDPLIVIMGASIMNAAFLNESTIRDTVNTNLGSDIEFQQYAIDGGRLQITA